MAMASTATLGLPIALMFLAGLAYSSQMQIKKSSSVQLPEGAFTANLTWEGTKLQMQCSALAKKSGHYFFKHDSKGICQAGSADFGQLGTGTERIVTADIPFVGILLGNSEGDIDLEVVLPNGKTCPPSSHGLPPYSIAGRPPTDRHGMAELHGVLYKLGGRRYPDLSATAAFEKLDLTSPSPAWVALPDAPFADELDSTGLQGYASPIDGTTRLFVTTRNLPDHVAGGNRLYIYYPDMGTWGTSGVISELYSSSLVQQGRWLLMVGGFYWDTGDTDKVFALDMEEPLKDGVLLKERLVKRCHRQACAPIMLSGEEGILCAGGYNTVDPNYRSVQFLPISNGRSTGPCRVLPREIDRIRNFAVLIDYGNGEIVMASHENDDWQEETILKWDPKLEGFVDSGHVYPKLSIGVGGTRIRSELVWRKCWKHL